MSSPHAPWFDAGSFQRTGASILETLTQHLRASAERSMPVLEPIEPTAMLDRIPAVDGAAQERPEERFMELLGAMVRDSNHLHHPGYVGHQISVPHPLGALAELTHALLSNGMAVYEMGQPQSVMERRVIEHLQGIIGFGERAGGVLTHGGSLGNLTALLAARQAKAGYDVWEEGQREPMSVLVSEQAHYCVSRATRVMGWGARGVGGVPVDERFRLDPSQLEASLQRAQDAGTTVLAVVASSCSTSAGSFDPIEPIADFCEEHGLWLHVDGAHGASFAWSERYRDRLRGIERADSVVWDLHKMMGLPALSTAVLFRDRAHSHGAFAQHAEYLFEETRELDERWFDIGTRTLECTKRPMGATAYLLMSALGNGWFERLIDTLMGHAETLAELCEAASDFELATEPQANIVCFRHRPAGVEPGAALDAHQVARRGAVIAGGSHYLVQTRLAGATWLRTTLMNPATERGDLVALLDAVRGSAAE